MPPSQARLRADGPPRPIPVPSSRHACGSPPPPQRHHRPARGSHWGQAFAAIDRDVQSLHDWHLDDPSDTYGIDRSEADEPSAVSPPLTELLTGAILNRPTGPDERRRWLATASATVEERVDAVVSNKHRRANARVASLAVAHAEALAVAGNASDGHAYLIGIREEYPRHTAFRSELDTAISTSTLANAHRPGSPTATRTPRRPGRRYS